MDKDCKYFQNQPLKGFCSALNDHCTNNCFLDVVRNKTLDDVLAMINKLWHVIDPQSDACYIVEKIKTMKGE